MPVREFYKSPLTIYVVWHPDNEDGLAYAEAVYNTFCRDTLSPLTRGLGIPVRFRFKPPAGQELPIDIDFSVSDRNAVVLLADKKIFLNDKWKIYIESLLDKENDKNRVFPVALSDEAFLIDENRLNRKQWIKLTDINDSSKEKLLLKRIAELKNRLLHDLCRMFFNLTKVAEAEDQLTPPPIKLFISHAKVDGEKLASDFTKYIVANTKLKTFFDANDIEDAEDFEKAILENLKNSAIVVFLSDKYSTREWCRIEVIVAKRNKSPLVVVNDLQGIERRSFPYIGNVPTIRYKADCFEDVIELSLFQVLNNLYLDEKLKKEIDMYQLSDNFRILPIQNAPELFNYIDIKHLQNQQDNRKILVIYPDPPLGTEELKVLNDLDQNIVFITPTLVHNLLYNEGK